MHARESPTQYRDRLNQLLGERDPLAVLEDTPRRLSAIIDSGGEDIRWSPGSGVWSAGEIAAHLADAELVWAYRMRIMLEQPGVELQAFDERRWAAIGRYADVAPAEACGVFTRLRAWNLRLLAGLTPEQWTIAAHHVERGAESVADLARLYAGHDLNHLQQLASRLRAARVEIVPFQPAHATAFATLNRAWLAGHDLLEPADEVQLRDPVGTILAAGGEILVAVDRVSGHAVGTCAGIPHAPGEWELAKLSVEGAYRGQGLGRALALACLDSGRRRGAGKAILVSSTRLAAALGLYKSLGFQDRPIPPAVPYATADVYMELRLDP